MERTEVKIGDTIKIGRIIYKCYIFNGEDKDQCKDCDLLNICRKDFIFSFNMLCTCNGRSDMINVVFKKHQEIKLKSRVIDFDKVLKRRDYHINTLLNYNNIKYKVIESNKLCEGCAFYFCTACSLIACKKEDRRDHKNVIIVKAE